MLEKNSLVHEGNSLVLEKISLVHKETLWCIRTILWCKMNVVGSKTNSFLQEDILDQKQILCSKRRIFFQRENFLYDMEIIFVNTHIGVPMKRLLCAHAIIHAKKWCILHT